MGFETPLLGIVRQHAWRLTANYKHRVHGRRLQKEAVIRAVCIAVPEQRSSKGHGGPGHRIQGRWVYAPISRAFRNLLNVPRGGCRTQGEEVRRPTPLTILRW